MELDTRLEAGSAITDRERFLLSLLRYHYDMDTWYLDQYPKDKRILKRDFEVEWIDDEDD